MGKALVIAAIVVGVALVLCALIWLVHRTTTGPTTRRRELRRAGKLAALTQRKLYQMETAANDWRDVDSVLATEIRKIIEEYRKEKEELER